MQGITLIPKPTTVSPPSSGLQITQHWSDLISNLTSGDTFNLSPEGGVLVLDSPLTVTGDVIISGAASVTSDASEGGGNSKGRRLAAAGAKGAGAPDGAVTIKCGKQTGVAFIIM